MMAAPPHRRRQAVQPTAPARTRPQEQLGENDGDERRIVAWSVSTSTGTATRRPHWRRCAHGAAQLRRPRRHPFPSPPRCPTPLGDEAAPDGIEAGAARVEGSVRPASGEGGKAARTARRGRRRHRPPPAASTSRPPRPPPRLWPSAGRTARRRLREAPAALRVGRARARRGGENDDGEEEAPRAARRGGDGDRRAAGAARARRDRIGWDGAAARVGEARAPGARDPETRAVLNRTVEEEVVGAMMTLGPRAAEARDGESPPRAGAPPPRSSPRALRDQELGGLDGCRSAGARARRGRRQRGAPTARPRDERLHRVRHDAEPVAGCHQHSRPLHPWAAHGRR